MATVYIGLGANIGNREANLRMALSGLTRMARVGNVSSLYETEAVGPEQPSFYNAVCRIQAGLGPWPLLRFLKSLEDEIGRRAGGERWGPRPIDLDILLYGDEIVEGQDLTIPHPRLAERAFALVPLAEIAPDVRHPAEDRTIAELAQRADASGVRRIKDSGWDGVVGTQERVRL
jgi:2-amino-4-hydroxy-6-hydroxymethyldihydropteridine diphosphokinase